MRGGLANEPMRGLGSGHVVSGPMRSLKNALRGEIQHTTHNTQHTTHRHFYYLTDPAQRAESVKIKSHAMKKLAIF